MRAPKPAIANRACQRFHHLVPPRRSAGIDLRDRVAPPLQSDAPEERLAHGFADARNLEIEGVEGEERFALVGRGEERGLEAVAVVAAQRGGERRKRP